MEAPPRTVKRARQLRRRMSLPEVLLWQELRKRTLAGHRFRRQHPIGPYILDFYCDSGRLVVEVDGESHNLGNRPERDVHRDFWLEAQGLRVLRLEARTVLKDMDTALLEIERALRPLHPLRGSPSPKGGGSSA